MWSAIVIVIGYATLIAQFGWIGVGVGVVHVVVLSLLTPSHDKRVTSDEIKRNRNH